MVTEVIQNEADTIPAPESEPKPKAKRKVSKHKAKASGKTKAKANGHARKTIATTSRSGKAIRRALPGGDAKVHPDGLQCVVTRIDPGLRKAAWKAARAKGVSMVEFIRKAIERAV